MHEFTGVIKTLGNSRINPNQTIYSAIEIGDWVLPRTEVPTALNAFISLGDDMRIWRVKHKVVALQRMDGKTFIDKVSLNAGTTLVFGVLGVISLPLYLIGVWPLYIAFKAFSERSAAKKVLAEFPNAILV